MTNDAERMDALQLLLLGADFQWGERGEPVIVIALPKGVGVSASLRDTTDRIIAAIRHQPTRTEVLIEPKLPRG